MTKFTDGPAAGIVLSLRRAPLFLRVVQDRKGKWDALDQIADMPEPGETIHVYRLVADRGSIHLCMRGGRGGTFRMAEYCLHAEQPDDDTARSITRWQAWAQTRADAAQPERSNP